MFYYPNPQVSLLEHILVDNWGAYASNFSSAITPCTNYVTEVGLPALNSGRTTAAQWIRVSFHDYVTANVSAGTGGVEASIGFETAREENSGSAFNDSFTFWQPFVNEHVSMSDLVALGTVMSVHLCGGKYIPYKPGRIDATEADPTTGVPAPDTSLEDTLAFFSRSGFNQADSIGLTACGHTLGSVHEGGFPTVVNSTAITPNNTNGGITFDSTRGVFDPLVVHEYIDGTGHMGGALVTSFNVSSRSDLRLYESDHNATMKTLYDQGDGFQDTCVDLLGRMINTVPSHVTLQDAISPMSIKPVNVTWDIGADDGLILSGKIRILWGAPTITNDIALSFSNGYNIPLTAESQVGSSSFQGTSSDSSTANGTTKYYPFSASAKHIANVSSFTVKATGLASQDFAISGPSSFIVPSLTNSTGADTIVAVAVALHDNSSLKTTDFTVKIAVPVPQPLTLAPKVVSEVVSLARNSRSENEFELWTGSTDAAKNATGAISITLERDGSIVDTLLISDGRAGW